MTKFNRRPHGGRIDRSKPIVMRFNGRPLPAFEGDTAASALLAQITEGAVATAPPAAKDKVTKALEGVPSTVTEPSLAPIAGPEPTVPRDVEDAPSAKKAMAEAGISRFGA